MDTTAAAMNVQAPTMLGPGVNAAGVRVVSQEIENAMGTESRADDADDEQSGVK
jgi:hypothetical protein